VRLVQHLRRHPGDAVVVAVAIAGQIDVWVGIDNPSPGLAVLVLAWSLVLLARRRFPLAAPLASWALIVVGAFVWEADVEEGYYALLGGVLDTYWIGADNERRRAIPGGLAAFALAQVVNRQFTEGGLSASDIVFVALLVGVPLTVGQAFRARAEQSRAVADRAARAAVERLAREQASIASERGRIARELHDVVGHSISVMTIQAGAARLLLDRDPAGAQGPLTAIEETGGETLAELRRLVGVLGEPDAGVELAPQPGLAELDRRRAAGRADRRGHPDDAFAGPRPRHV
jgi:signal transduction histidine kinase